MLSTDEFYPHMTVQYLCCLSLEGYLHLAELLLSIEWEPIPVTYGQIGCNLVRLMDTTESVTFPDSV